MKKNYSGSAENGGLSERSVKALMVWSISPSVLDKGPSMEADTGAALFPAWWRILNKATDKTPSRRYQSAKALIRDLNALRLKMSVASARRSWMFYAAVGILLALVAGTYIHATSRERIRLESEIESLKQMNAEMDKKAKTAAQDAWEAMMRNAYRRTFPDISEEKLSSMIEQARERTFGGKK